MSWYYGTFSCGHEGRVNIIGPTKDRQWRADRKFSGSCPDCYEKMRQEEMDARNREAEEKSKEMELPALEGSEKQVAWANTLRLNFIDYYEEKMSHPLPDSIERQKTPYGFLTAAEIKAIIIESVEYGMQQHTDARFWIDNRDEWRKVTSAMVAEYKSRKSEVPKDVAQEMENDRIQLTVIPENCRKDGVVRILYAGNEIHAKYIKDDDFRAQVKKLGYSWDFEKSTWTKKITEYTGDADNRAAEIGNALLAEGFTVEFPTKESKEAAVSGQFSPECKRWVKYHPGKKKLSIAWKERNDTIYEAAKKLPGAKWNMESRSMLVSVEFYREVEDFAETLGFSISKAAKAGMEQYIQKENGYEKGTPTAPDRTEVSDQEKIEKSLKSGGTIISDLVDD